MRLDVLEEIRILHKNKEKTVKLVYHPFEQRYYVMKILYAPYHPAIYQALQKHPHKGIASVYEVSMIPSYCLVLEEFVNSATLEYEMSARRLTREEVFTIMRELLDAVEHLHQLSPPIIHRDIKPSNLMLDNGHIKLIDFEIARVYDEQRTRDTTLLGSEGYAAPEQYGFAQTDPRTDIYAIGVVFQELLANANIIEDRYLQIIQICLAMAKEQRYQSIQELRSSIFSKKTIRKASRWWYLYDANAIFLGFAYAMDTKYHPNLASRITGGFMLFSALFLVHAIKLDLWGITTSFTTRHTRSRFLYYLQLASVYSIAFLVISYILFLVRLILQSLL